MYSSSPSLSLSRQKIKKIGLILGPSLFFIILLLPIGGNETNGIKDNAGKNNSEINGNINDTGTTDQNNDNNHSSASLSFPAKLVLAITFWMAVWWITEAIPIYITALMPLILFPSLSLTELGQTAANYADRVIFLFLGGFILAKAVEKTQLHKRFALNILNVFGTNPKYVVAAFMLVTGILSGWMSNTATTMLMLPIAAAVISQIGVNRDIKKDSTDRDRDNSRFGLCLMLSIAYSASIGGMATLIGTPPNAILASLSKSMIDTGISFGEWLLIGLPISGISLVVAWIYMVHVGVKITDLKSIDKGKEIIKDKLNEIGKITKDEKTVAAVFAATATAWITRGLIWGDFAPMVDDSTIAITAAFSLFLIPSKSSQRDLTSSAHSSKSPSSLSSSTTSSFDKGFDGNNKTDDVIEDTNREVKGNADAKGEENVSNGKRILDWDTAVTIPWGVLLLLGGGLALAHAFTTTGLDGWISSQLLFVGNLDYILIVLVIVAVGVLSSEIISNTATAALLIPIAVSLSSSISIDPLLLMVPLTIATSFGFIMPVGTPPNAIVFGSGYVTAPKMAKAGFPLDVIGIIMVTLLSTVMVPLIWGK